MIKLSEPEDNIEDALGACIESMQNEPDRNRHEAILAALIAEEADYSQKGMNAELWEIDPIRDSALDDQDDPPLPIIGSITHQEMTDLYSTRLVKRVPGRKVYDRIMTNADQQCPFCGGIGNPRNLDHFLPKAHFPLFSILPLNLIPSCRDCNMDGKGQSYAKTKNDQIIHPYLDSECFFEEQWIEAEYHAGNPGEVRYFFSPPEHWSSEDKERAKSHFSNFDLAKIYGREAAAYLAEVSVMIDFISVQLGQDKVKAFLQESLDASLFPNHWRRIMLQSLIKSL